MTSHIIVLDASKPYDYEHYKITHRSRNVFSTTALRLAPTRLVVWQNHRPNPFYGAELGDVIGDQTVNEYFLATGRTKPRLLDPQNKPTDEPVTLLLSPESSALCANTDLNTGQPGSGQVFARGVTLDREDTATLVYPDGTTREVTLHFPPYHNGHGYATFNA
jgi:hypothetical protein